MNLQTLFVALHRDGRVALPETPTIIFDTLDNPWYLRALMGFMGLLGGLLVLGFFGFFLVRMLDSALGAAALSMVLFFGANAIYRAVPRNDFATQLALAASIASQLLAVLAIGRAAGPANSAAVALMVAVMQFALVLLVPNYLHRLLSTLFAVTALYVAAFTSVGGSLQALVDATVAVALVAMSLSAGTLAVSGHHRLAEPVIHGLAIALLVVGAAHFAPALGVAGWRSHGAFHPVGLALALIGWTLWSTRSLAVAAQAAAGVAIIIFCAVTWRAPGLIASALVLLIAFSQGRRALAVLAQLAMVAYLSAYYYQMHLTLLEKSGVLVAAAALMFIFWWVQRRLFSMEAA